MLNDSWTLRRGRYILSASGFLKNMLLMAFSLGAFLPQQSSATSPVRNIRVENHFIVSFPGNAQVLQGSAKVAMARHLPCIRSIHLEIVAARIWSATPNNQQSAHYKKDADNKRALAIRQFFTEAGIPDERIYIDIAPIRSSGSSVTESRGTQKEGTVEIQYLGLYKEGFEAICAEHSRVAQ